MVYYLIHEVFISDSDQVARAQSHRVVMKPSPHIQRSHVEKVFADPPWHRILDTILQFCDGLDNDSIFTSRIAAKGIEKKCFLN